MNSEEIIEMAKQVDREFCIDEESFNWIEAFAKLVAAKEREACANIAENWRCNGMPRTGVANEIRARGNT